MARNLTVLFSRAIYYVTCRMAGDWRTEKAFLFKDDADHERFREFVESGLAESDEEFKVALKESPRSIGSGSAVCKQPARLPEKLSKDRRLRRQVEQAEVELAAARRARAKERAGEQQ